MADRVLHREFALERESALASARRAAQRAHWATVHDTSATTLLMIGLGDVRGDESWLAAQVRRDLGALRGPNLADSEVDLAEELAAVAANAHLDVAFVCTRPERVPWVVATALAGATSEALENVRRHAGVDRADLCLQAADGAVVVSIVDAGCGFDPAQVLPGRHGLTRSITGRMADAGGTAQVESAPQMGTTVRLEWHRG
ncbi:MAG: sensor histidine kinase [Pseudonocardiaceae bacterium]